MAASVEDEVDLATQSNPTVVAQRHISLELAARFDLQQLTGTATITVEVLDTQRALATGVIFDTNNLEVHGVQVQGEKAGFTLGEPHPAFGRALTVPLPPAVVAAVQGGNPTFKVSIAYNTTSASIATQWLDAAQTSGKKHPFLFTQCQAIHARSLVPCQDTPQVKVTYDATVTAPAPLTVIMSALGNGDPPVASSAEGGTRTFAFKQPVAMASYLIAIAVGELETRPVGDRTAVWAEPEVVGKAAHEFAEMEDMLKAGESICGPYVWTRYDVLCMPPSFPYGGMENPCLTFVTPTLLAGDRSLADVVAHEITHSWTGNLVTNRTWKHFWLNEGWTKYVERKIVEKLHGRAVAELTCMTGMKALQDSVAHFGEDHEFTKLQPDLHGVDPDDAFSSVPYEKGYSLLRYLEGLVGGPEAFAPFVIAYVAEFAYKTLTSDDFRQFFTNYWNNKGVDTSMVDWETWYTAVGMPPVTNEVDGSLAVAPAELKQRWATGGDGCSSADIDGWVNGQTLRFLDSLLDDDFAAVSTAALLTKMDSVYSFSSSGNAEVRFRWQRLGIQAEMPEIIPQVIKLVTEQGRMKFTRTLYRALFNSKMGQAAAVDTYKANAKMYHPICGKMVRRDLKLD